MVVFYVGLAVGLVLAVVYLGVSALSFVRIRRQLITGAADVVDTAGREGVGLVPGFRWKASLAVLTSCVVQRTVLVRPGAQRSGHGRRSDRRIRP
jgi:hypothetical protein